MDSAALGHGSAEKLGGPREAQARLRGNEQRLAGRCPRGKLPCDNSSRRRGERGFEMLGIFDEYQTFSAGRLQAGNVCNSDAAVAEQTASFATGVAARPAGAWN